MPMSLSRGIEPKCKNLYLLTVPFPPTNSKKFSARKTSFKPKLRAERCHLKVQTGNAIWEYRSCIVRVWEEVLLMYLVNYKLDCFCHFLLILKENYDSFNQNRSSVCTDHKHTTVRVVIYYSKLIGPGPTGPTPGYGTLLHKPHMLSTQIRMGEGSMVL